MRIFIPILILLFGVLSAKAQLVDNASYGDKNYRAVMGGGDRVQVDSLTPLPNLIKKLEDDWKFVETGKAYWIGYTDNMYSIARYKDKAIDPLVKFIDSTSSLKAKRGALFTLHLIGIDCSVIGRFTEDFENKRARNALLKFLTDNTLNEQVVYLIMRDPWLSDLPKLMDYLSQPGKDYSKVISALRRYKFKGKPLGQEITDAVFKKNITINFPDSKGMQSIYELITFQRDLKPYFAVDKEITESPDWVKRSSELLGKTSSTQNSSVVFFFHSNDVFSFCDFDDSYNYVFQNHKVEVFGPVKTRRIWLTWWRGLPQQEKDTFLMSNHIP